MIFLGSPYNMFSWNYLLTGEGHRAYWQDKWTSKQCSILIDDALFEVKKHGITSVKWTLEHDGQVYCTGQKQSVLRRSFDIESPMGIINLGSIGAFRRGFFRLKWKYQFVVTPLWLRQESSTMSSINRVSDS